jgi:CRP-like cAMP-binding protein
MPRKDKTSEFDPEAFLQTAGVARTSVEFSKRNAIYSQGGTGDSVFYIQKGRVRVSVVSKSGKEATLALLGPGDFIGEDCISLGQKRMASAT